MIAVSFVGLYLLSSGASWALFSYLKGDPKLQIDNGGIRARIDPGLPKTQECPINGKLYSKPEEDIWQERRPITVMIENHVDSRPSSGLNRADVVYEAVAESGITRFLAVYYCGTSAQEVKIAPVRSARVYFISWAAEYGDRPIFMHVGGANDYAGFGDTTRAARALEQLESMGWRFARGNDFDTTYDSAFPVFWRNYERLDHSVATEHTMMASLDEAYKEAEKRGFSKEYEGQAWDDEFSSWKFADDKALSSPQATNIRFQFWENIKSSEAYEVVWKYDKDNNRYLRENGGELAKDLDTDEQLSARNVVIQFVRERRSVDRNRHILYTTIGEGNALIFQNGGVIEGTWEKRTQTSRTKFLDDNGKEISFVRGEIWIEAVPIGNDIEY